MPIDSHGVFLFCLAQGRGRTVRVTKSGLAGRDERQDKRDKQGNPQKTNPEKQEENNGENSLHTFLKNQKTEKKTFLPFHFTKTFMRLSFIGRRRAESAARGLRDRAIPPAWHH